MEEQRTPALGQIEAARARGQLNPTGFETAMAALTGQGQAAQSQLRSIGSNVLGQYRSRLGELPQQAFGALEQTGLGQQFDPGQFTGRLQSTVDQLRGQKEGDIRSALGGTSLFSVPQLIGKAGQAQGQVNQPSGILSALEQREKERQQQRGVGSQGVF
jgi:hypothetical protein